MKLQMGVFLPIWSLLVLDAFWDERNIKSLLGMLLGIVITQTLLILPFALSDEGLQPFLKMVVDSFSIMPNISICAYNGWCWFFPDYRTASDMQISLIGLTYKQIGLGLFCLSSFLAMFPLLKILALRIFNKKDKELALDRVTIWLIAALISLCFFFFNTEMHERYSHPAFIFLTAYSFYSKNFIPYILFSLAYFLNLEHILQWLKLPSYGTVIFDEKFVAALYAILIIYLFFLLYRRKTSGLQTNTETPNMG